MRCESCATEPTVSNPSHTVCLTCLRKAVTLGETVALLRQEVNTQRTLKEGEILMHKEDNDLFKQTVFTLIRKLTEAEKRAEAAESELERIINKNRT